MSFFIVAFLSVFLASCGDDNNNRSNDLPQEQSQRQEGVFETLLEPVSGGSTQGHASFDVDPGDRFSANVTMENGVSGGTYRQYILASNTCPTLADDIDGNGQLSMAEAQARAGLILVPLDNNLKEQEAGGIYPTPDANGSYTYSGGTNMEDMMVDLRGPDTNDSDNIIKLNPDERGLNMEGRVVMITRIQGAQEIAEACGVLIRGTVARENEEAPAPIGNHFSTRLNNRLLIAGDRCQGGESLDLPDGETQICNTDQWLVVVDNVNTCTTDGACTEVGILPIIANLRKATGSFYDILAASPTSDNIRSILGDHWVRFEPNRTPEVRPKN